MIISFKRLPMWQLQAQRVLVVVTVLDAIRARHVPQSNHSFDQGCWCEFNKCMQNVLSFLTNVSQLSSLTCLSEPFLKYPGWKLLSHSNWCKSLFPVQIPKKGRLSGHDWPKLEFRKCWEEGANALAQHQQWCHLPYKCAWASPSTPLMSLSLQVFTPPYLEWSTW